MASADFDKSYFITILSVKTMYYTSTVYRMIRDIYGKLISSSFYTSFRDLANWNYVSIVEVFDLIQDRNRIYWISIEHCFNTLHILSIKTGVQIYYVDL